VNLSTDSNLRFSRGRSTPDQASKDAREGRPRGSKLRGLHSFIPSPLLGEGRRANARGKGPLPRGVTDRARVGAPGATVRGSAVGCA
jgi:hypothetical protein